MKKRKQKYSVFKFVVVVVVLLFIIIGYFLYNKSTENYNKLKIDKSKQIVYTEFKRESGYYYQFKPLLNLKGETSDKINADITSYFNTFDKDNICITYEYNLNGKVLSLVIKVEDYSYVDSAAVLYFRSYNIKLDNMEILSNEKILNYFDMTESDASEKLNNKINEYYYQLVNNEIIDEDECDYDCFIKSRDFNLGADDNEYYVKNGKLVVFKPYVFMSSSDEDNEIVYDFEL